MRAGAIAIATLLTLATVEARADDYPFIGKWDCEVATFTFTNSTYNNGSETLRMTRVDKKGGEYTLSFPKNYKIVLSGITKARMNWFSSASGDGFTCKKVK